MAEQRTPVVRLPETTRKQPDYRLEAEEPSVYFEVKEFQRPKPFPDGGFSPLPYVRRKLRKARQKFDEYGDSSCCLVLYNDQSIAVSLAPSCILSVMFGEYYRVHDNGRLSFEGAAELRSNQNTTVSALVVLRPLPLDPITVAVGEAWHSEQVKIGRCLEEAEIRKIYNSVIEDRMRRYPALDDQVIIRAIVHRNPYAARPLPPGLFQGPFDEWWDRSGEYIECTFRGARLQKLWAVFPDYARVPVAGQV